MPLDQRAELQDTMWIELTSTRRSSRSGRHRLTTAEFYRYLDAYNRGDFAAVHTYYADDIRFDSYGQVRTGAAVMEFLQQLDQMVSHRIVPRNVEVDGDRITLQAETTISAKVDAQLPSGAIKAGEQRTLPMNITYETAGNLILSVTVR